MPNRFIPFHTFLRKGGNYHPWTFGARADTISGTPMNSTRPAISQANRGEGLTLRQAALIAGFAYLLGPVTYAEFSIYPKLVIAGNIEQTVLNLAAHRELFAVAILCYLIEFIEDIVIAWALYVLLVPVNRALSLVTAWFRLMYTAIAFFGLLKLVTVFSPRHRARLPDCIWG